MDLKLLGRRRRGGGRVQVPRQRANTHYSIRHPPTAYGNLIPDRPDVTDSPFTVDAGHIQFESGLFSYALSRPDQQGVVTEEFDMPIRISGSGLPTTQKLIWTFHRSISSIRDFLFRGSTHGSRDQVSSSFRPNLIFMGTTALRSRARRRLVSFQG